MDDYDKMIANTDQAAESIKLLAPVIYSYFSELIKQGFEREEALQLVMAYQTMMFNIAKGQG